MKRSFLNAARGKAFTVSSFLEGGNTANTRSSFSGTVSKFCPGLLVRKAMSMLLEEMQRLIKLDYGTAPHINELESYIRKNKLIILLYGQQLDLSKYLAEAAKTISVHALTPMRTTMREDGLAVDVVLLTGGGAEYYIDAAKEIFPRSLVEVSNQSALANARGFYYLGA